MKFVVLLLTLGVATLLAAEPRRPHFVRHAAADAAAVKALRQYLDLSEEQTHQLEQLREQTRAAAMPTLERLQSNQTALHQMLNSAAHPDETRTGQLVSESNALRTQIETLRLENAKKAAAMLTPEQQQRLNALLGRIEVERQAAPHAMPESWPMVHAAADLGLTRPPFNDRRRVRNPHAPVNH